MPRMEKLNGYTAAQLRFLKRFEKARQRLSDRVFLSMEIYFCQLALAWREVPNEREKIHRIAKTAVKVYISGLLSEQRKLSLKYLDKAVTVGLRPCYRPNHEKLSRISIEEWPKPLSAQEIIRAIEAIAERMFPEQP